MKLSNLIDERDERTRKRKKIKRKMDSIIGLSNDVDKQTMKLSVSIAKMADNTIRLLDEGYFDSGFVIKKGTLEKYLNGQNQYVRGYELTDDGWRTTDVLNLTDDFVGTVNIGHMEFATFPFIVGEWTKKDLSLVDIENDRKGIDVSVNLDEDSIFIQELKRQPYDIGISSEFYYHINEEDTEALSEMLDMYMPVIDEVFIFAYGLVGECGNVNSTGLELKGVDMSKDIEKVTLDVELENAEEAIEEIEEIEDKIEELGAEEIDITVNEEEAVEETAEEEVIENSADDAEEKVEEEEVAEESESDEEDEVEEDEVDDEDLDDEDEIEEVDELTEALSLIHDLNAQVAELTNRIAEKDKKIRRLSKKIATEKEAKAKFLEETKNLSVELYQNEFEAEQQKAEEIANAEETKDYVLTGGIADI